MTVVPTLDIAAFLSLKHVPIVDVRSPIEFLKSRIPSAINVPLFSDEERAEIGTLYKQSSQQAAIQRGTEVALAKSNDLLSTLRTHVPEGNQFVLYCWRGGMRSEGFAKLCIENGMRPLKLLAGYKSYRRAVLSGFDQELPLIVVSGSTGCGKTELLKLLDAAGEQTIDLESLAHHRGSAFGGICQPTQPTVEQFENSLFEVCRKLDLDRPIWVEDESRAIGRVSLPAAFWRQLSHSPAVVVHRDLPSRVESLFVEYGHFPPEELNAAITRLKKRLGGQRYQAATTLVNERRIHPAIELVLEYYDKAYAKALAARPGATVDFVELPSPIGGAVVSHLIALGRRLRIAAGAASAATTASPASTDSMR